MPKLDRAVAFAAAMQLLSALSGGAPSAMAAGTLVKVPAGNLSPFWIEQKSEGKKQERPAPVRVEAFSAQPSAVTHAEYIRFLRARPEWRKSKASPLFVDAAYLSQFSGDLTLKKGVNAQAPVTFVSWHAALAYCEHLGLRLPTVNEWEYMAAASETSTDASKDPAFLARILDWYGKPRKGELPAVKSTYRNAFGIYDLHGLVWEWTEDFNSSFGTGESREDSALNRDLFCGAGNLSGGDKENYAAFMRFAFRSSLKGRSAIWNLGFRCVR